LERIGQLPVADQRFDIVICSDVLEHLDNLHQTFAELVRVSRRYLLISLPNCWAVARQPIGRGTGSIGHYGLPPTPRHDRHKWFFSLTQARDFAVAEAAQHELSVVEMRVREKTQMAAGALVAAAALPATRTLSEHIRSHALGIVRTNAPGYADEP
jgi:2-polyprenyl-3-methyl-5-hydroxy-6-metoxy-1,4-benzoquinol methylase